MGYLSTLHLPHSFSTVSLDTARNLGWLVVGYFAVLAVYRLYFHPLAKYPGPLLGRLTDWYNLYHAYYGDSSPELGVPHLALYHAHQAYGPVVRFGPNLISFSSATALKTIYGHTASARAFQKSEFYKAFPAVKGVHNTHNAISKTEHGRKRRVLSAAFSDTALKGVEDLVLENVDAMMAKVRGEGPEGLDMGAVFSWFTFDVMGALCFGRSFDMLKSPAQRFMTTLVDMASHSHYIAGNYLLLKSLGLSRVLFPNITGHMWRFIQYSRSCANDRMTQGQGSKKDFFYYLLDAKDPETGEGFSTKELWGEANVLMIAGSDTTGTALSAAMFYLCRHPDKLARLTQEIRQAFTSTTEIATGKQLAACRYLTACVDEAMRLSPPVPGLLPREVVAAEGCVVDGVHLPAGTVTGVPIYTIHHNPAYYPDPFSYKPERFFDEEASEVARSAFTPFSIGPRGCIGKAVAYMELRLALARIVFEYDPVEVPTEGKGALWREGWAVREDEYRLMDHFTARKEGPVVRFVPAAR